MTARRSFDLALAATLLSCVTTCAAPRGPAGTVTGSRAPALVVAPPPRSLYVASFDEADDALAFAIANRIGELTLYGLGAPLGSSPQALADFIARAHHANVTVVAPIAARDRVEALAAYSEEHPESRFDGWVTEDEFWNGPEEERATRFAATQALLLAMRARAPTGTWVGVYLGYPTRDEAAWLVEHVDRVYASMAVTSPIRLLDHGSGTRSHRARHEAFEGRVPIWPILYARGDAHMRDWLAQHTLQQTEQAVRDSLGGHLDGVAYFDFRSVVGLSAFAPPGPRPR